MSSELEDVIEVTAAVLVVVSAVCAVSAKFGEQPE